MTPASLLHFAEALLWCALLFVSIAGYGAILLRLFGLHRPSIALAATSGVGVVIFLGGCLNLVQAITTPILLALILLGLVAAILLRITITEPEPQAKPSAPPPLAPPRPRLPLLLFSSPSSSSSGLAQPCTQASIRPPTTTTSISPLRSKCFSSTTMLRTPSASAASCPASAAATSSRPWFSPLSPSRTSRWPTALSASSFSPSWPMVWPTSSASPDAAPHLCPSRLLHPAAPVQSHLRPSAQRPLLRPRLPRRQPQTLRRSSHSPRASYSASSPEPSATTKSTYLPHGVIFVACLALFHWRQTRLLRRRQNPALRCPRRLPRHGALDDRQPRHLRNLLLPHPRSRLSVHRLRPLSRTLRSRRLASSSTRSSPSASPSSFFSSSSGFSATATNRAKPSSLSLPPPSPPLCSSASPPAETPCAATTTPACSPP